jgi:hypothetical protein
MPARLMPQNGAFAMLSLWGKLAVLTGVASFAVAGYMLFILPMLKGLPLLVIFWLPDVVIWSVSFALVYRSRAKNARDVGFAARLVLIPILVVIVAVYFGFGWAWIGGSYIADARMRAGGVGDPVRRCSNS